MKRILIALTVVALSYTAMAQSKMNHSMKMKNCVVMKDGKMMTMTDGKTMPMKHSMTMNDGTMVLANGWVKMKSGKTMRLKDGYCVEMSGKIEKMPMKDMQKM